MYEILTHGDVDGIVAAHLFSVAHPGEIQGVTITEEFGEFKGSDESTVMTDMRPFKAGFLGTVYDHHLGYDEDGYREGERKFNLVWKDIPASGIVYEEFKDKIPKEERWKTVIGYVGDGATNKIPSELWIENSELLDDVLYLYEYRGDVGASRLKVYQALSSPLNSACKIGQPKTALEILARAKRPLDIIGSNVLRSHRIKIKMEISGILKDGRAQVFSNQIVYFPYRSDLPGLQGELGSKLGNKFNLTVITHNIDTNNLSIRGILADLLVENLNKAGYKAGGHHGYAGVTDPNKGDIVEVIQEVARMIGPPTTSVIKLEEEEEQKGG